MTPRRGGTHHFALAASADPPNGPTWIHFVALHFSPLVVGQLPCRLVLSVSPFGVKLHDGGCINLHVCLWVSMCATLDTLHRLAQVTACRTEEGDTSIAVVDGYTLISLVWRITQMPPQKMTAIKPVSSHAEPLAAWHIRKQGVGFWGQARTCRTAEHRPGAPSRLRRPWHSRTTAGRSPCLPPGGTPSLPPPLALSCRYF